MGCTNSKIAPVTESKSKPLSDGHAKETENGTIRNGSGSVQHEVKLKDDTGSNPPKSQSNGTAIKKLHEWHDVISNGNFNNNVASTTQLSDRVDQDLEQDEVENEIAKVITQRESRPGVNSSTNLFTATSNSSSLQTVQKEYRKPLAFDVGMDGKLRHDTFSSLRKRPPRILESLSADAPKLTAEELQQKLKAAEEKRQKELSKKKKQAKQMSKRKRELLRAKEIDQAEAKSQTLKTKLDSTSQNRAKAHADIVEKQKKREERAKQVRERARKIKEGEAVDGHNDEDATVETYHVESDDDDWNDNRGILEQKPEEISHQQQQRKGNNEEDRPPSTDDFYNT